jgi:hypothetical protein
MGEGPNRTNSTVARPPGCERGPGSLPSSEGVQLSKLSSVLNGLENGASAIRRHVHQAMSAVRAGTYQVDPLQLSKRIVGEALGSA